MNNERNIYDPLEISDQERKAYLAKLDAEQANLLDAYRSQCVQSGIKPNLTFLMENFGIGAGDVYNDDEINAMIVKEQKKTEDG